MVISKKDDIPLCSLKNDNCSIEQVKSFNYLGAMITSDCRSKMEIKRRIALSKDAFNKMKDILLDRKMSVPIKIRLLKTYVWSVLLYGCESWTLHADTKSNLEAAEMWFYRRMLRVSYVDRVKNEDILGRLGQDRQILNHIKKRQLQFLGHVIRKEQIEELSLTGKFEGKKARGRQRYHFMDNFDLGPAQMVYNQARDRETWQKVVRRTLNQ